MQKRLILNQEISLHENKYKIIGIDTYSLKNILDENKQWISYTLLDDENNKTWISYGVKEDYFIEWALLSEAEFKNKSNTQLNNDLTGIATISFLGNPGYSTPTAELVWFNAVNQKFDYLIVERFLKQTNTGILPLEPYYQSGTILYDFKI